jgi:AraC family transcriptional activator of pyochelin receptor
MEKALKKKMGSSGLSSKQVIHSLQLVKKIIEKNLDEKVSQSYLCKKSGLNEFKLKKGFKELFGISLREYQLLLKIDRAKSLLAKSNDRITDIAYSLGYEHAHNFTLEFKRRVGLSPRQWRKANK